MKRLAFPIAVALLSGAVLVAVPFSAALAQIETGGVDKRAANTRAARNAEKNKTKQATENPYPNASRKEPEAKASSKLGKKIDKAVKALYDEKYDEAEHCFRRAIAIRQMSLGNQHPDTAASFHAFAEFLVEKGDYGAAFFPVQNAFSIRMQLGGMDDSDTMKSYHLLNAIMETINSDKH